MRNIILSLALALSINTATPLSAQSHLGANISTANIASVSFDIVGSFVQYIHVFKNGTETLHTTDASGIWRVPAGKKFVILSSEVLMYSPQAASSPGVSIMSTVRGTNGLQVGMPFFTVIKNTDLVANEWAHGTSQWPSGIVIPAGLGISNICGSFDGQGINFNTYQIIFYGYFIEG